ncbi:hypothetical protein RFI_17352 [Reticulomyxa filosa]|uniref:Uncharacterized protein n=1 Tax=Reticulomyxa filosa TaxID=46433 RepID=X6N2D3_RETFI|nr:hypothetical protein RFI_17352 [Reticulomyxa filosa]|eukprot:ETO19874.1 hypothetical protein RFI_17352 [Reticulomyxa filosa]
MQHPVYREPKNWASSNTGCGRFYILIFVSSVIALDMLMTAVHWQRASCSRFLVVWSLIKYLIGLLSYVWSVLRDSCPNVETRGLFGSYVFEGHEQQDSHMAYEVVESNCRTSLEIEANVDHGKKRKQQIGSDRGIPFQNSNTDDFERGGSCSGDMNTSGWISSIQSKFFFW